MTIGTELGSGVFYDGKLIANFKLSHLLWKEGKVIEKYAVDSVRKQENLEFYKWGERLRHFRCRRKCCGASQVDNHQTFNTISRFSSMSC